MSKITDFYQFPSTKIEGIDFCFNDIYNWSVDVLESKHDYIQWFFPTGEPSKFNPDAPICTEQDLQILTLKQSQHQQKKAFAIFLWFLGLEYNPTYNKIEKSSHFDFAKRIWISDNNHNYLRITRVLTSLRMFGNMDEARAFLNILIEIAGEYNISPVTQCYWFDAVDPYELEEDV